ncbi:rRNA methyltransferase 1 [Spatholobus suberectus]|nr:rRNA methyltransferase 1 [Spatholobus suberectus]
MYTTISKAQAFPLAAKISSQPKCFTSPIALKSQFLPLASHQNPILKNPSSHKFGSFEMGKQANPRGLMLQIARRYCGARSAEKQLPWLEVANEVKEEGKVVEKAKMTRISGSIQEGSAKKVGSKSSWEQSVERLDKSHKTTVSESTKGGVSAAASNERKSGMIGKVGEHRSDCGKRYVKFDDNDEEGVDDEMGEEIDDPRWDNIKNRFKGMVGAKVGLERPEFRRWNKQENWGKKTWKEATESTVPKIVGEGIYGVGPVLAALSAGRREFYALYTQEGLDLGSNNRKKKDKKGFEKVLKIAEKFGLSVKEASKHDLNMVVDNRPHQGLVLDASPLEMVKIKELDPVSIDEGKGSLWVALDEVTDPQNLGAIIRSAYFFGASGVVLCAKNSAPLSGVVSKASAGSLELMELRSCKNMMQFLVSSAENGWRVLGGSVSSKAISLDEVVLGPPTILVLGSEGTGLRPLVERSCTQLVRIPGNIPFDSSTSELDGESSGLNSQSSGTEFLSFLAVESLNVSVAAGVLLHHLIGKSFCLSNIH